jgi:hypothetical protein
MSEIEAKEDFKNKRTLKLETRIKPERDNPVTPEVVVELPVETVNEERREKKIFFETKREDFAPKETPREEKLPYERTSSQEEVQENPALTGEKEDVIFSIKELKRKKPAELLEIAESCGVDNGGGMLKQDLVFSILKRRAEQGGTITGEGVIEVLQEPLPERAPPTG